MQRPVAAGRERRISYFVVVLPEASALGRIAPELVSVLLPEVEPVPVAPIELVPPVPDVVLLDVSVLAVPVLPIEDEPLVEPGCVEAVEGLVEDGEPGVLDEAVPSRFWQAPSERVATTARAAAVAWVGVIFIRELLEWAAVAALPRL